MSKYYKGQFRIKSSRKEGHNYSFTGDYFVTINLKEAWFGSVVNKEMQLSGAGKLAVEIWKEMPVHFDNVNLGEFIAMPDHFHGIISIKKFQYPDDAKTLNGGITGTYNPMLSRNSVSKIVRWFKGRSSFEIRKTGLKQFEWQSRFHDSIIRSKVELEKVRQYIRNNPRKFNTSGSIIK